MVRLGKTLLVCGTKPTPLATSRLALRPVMSSPRSGDRAGAHLDQAEDRLEQRRLAGAVRADDADQLAVVHVEVAAVEDVDAGHVAGDHLVGAQQRVLGRASCALRSSREIACAPGSPRRPRPRRPLRRPAGVGRCSSARRLVHAHFCSSCSARSRSSASSASARTCCSSSSVRAASWCEPEVGVDDALVAHDRVRRALGDDLALGHHDDPVARCRGPCPCRARRTARSCRPRAGP